MLVYGGEVIGDVKVDSIFIGSSSSSRNKMAWSGTWRMSGYDSPDVFKSTKFRL